MSLDQFRIKNNQIIIQFLPFFILAVLCLFIYLDGSILSKSFYLGSKGFLYVGLFVLVASVPPTVHFFYFKKKIKEINKKIIRSCYVSIYLMFLIDILLVTFMPVKFCGVIGQLGFAIAFLVLGNLTSEKFFCFWNGLFTFTSMVSPFIENTFTPSSWEKSLIIEMPAFIITPSIVFIMTGITIINFFTLKDAKKTFEIYNSLEYSNTHDKLTGAFNRSVLSKELLKNKFFIIGDIDKFKKVNDTYGHLKGDQCLIKFVEIIKSNLNERERIIRYGGEEFIIVLDCEDQIAADKKADFLRNEIEEKSKDVLLFTVSFGLSFFTGEDLDSNIKKADSFLYVAKSLNRNAVCSETGCFRNGFFLRELKPLD